MQIEKKLGCRCVPTNFVKVLRTTFSRTCANCCCFWYLGISLRQDILYKVHIEEVHSFLQHFGIHTFQIDFRILQNLRGVFTTISNIYDEAFLQKYLTALSRYIFAGTLHHKYLFGSVLNTALQPCFLYFSTFFV